MTDQKETIIAKLNEAFLPKNIECDGGCCMGCWKDIVRKAIKMIETLPVPCTEQKEISEEEIEGLFLAKYGNKITASDSWVIRFALECVRKFSLPFSGSKTEAVRYNRWVFTSGYYLTDRNHPTHDGWYTKDNVSFYTADSLYELFLKDKQQP